MNESLRLLTQKITKLPTIPAVANRIIQLVNAEASNVEAIVETIERDPSISAKIIGFANAAFFRSTDPVTTIRDAVMKIGFNNVRSIALSISLLTIFKPSPEREKYYQMQFRHGLAVGIISKELAEYLGWKSYEDLFTAGLLHDLGYLALNAFFPEEYVALLKSPDREVPFIEQERSTMGFTHSEMGGWLAETWNLPEGIRETIRYHHAPARAGAYRPMACVVHLADAMATGKGFPPIPVGNYEASLAPETFVILGLAGTAMEELSPGIDEALAQAQELRP